MNRLIGTFIGCAMALGGLAQAPGQTPAQPAIAVERAPRIEVLGWLAGTWITEGSPVIEEHWMVPKGGAMLGLSRTLARGRMASFEFLRIESTGKGIDYVASPGGGPATRFRLIRATATEALFENLAHNFPKRIIYRLRPDGALWVRIEGDGSEREKPLEFSYRRLT